MKFVKCSCKFDRNPYNKYLYMSSGFFVGFCMMNVQAEDFVQIEFLL